MLQKIIANSFLFAWILFAGGPLHAQLSSSAVIGDRWGTFYTYAAKSVGAGSFYFLQNTRYYSGTADRSTGTSTVSEKIKDMNAVLGFNVGFSHDFDMIINGNFYQIANRAPSIPESEVSSFLKNADIPEEFYISLRYIPFSFAKGRFNVGMMFTGKIESGSIANAPFQDYSAGTKEVGLTLLTSYFQSPSLIENGLAVHFNLQYWNYLDKGSYLGFNNEDTVRALTTVNGNQLADTAIAGSNTASLKFAIGASYPFVIADRYLYIIADIYGNHFLSKPPAVAYSRQNYAYFAMGIKYNLFPWMGIHAGGEHQIMKSTEPTFSSIDLQVQDLTLGGYDYPKYRVFAGLSFPITPRALIAASSDEVELTSTEREIMKRKEVEDVLYSEQEIQRRSVNFKPITEMRKVYKNSISGYIDVLAPKDKKPVEETTSDDSGE